MKTTFIAALIFLSTVALSAATYDYWATLSPGGSTTTPAGKTEKVLVVIGNNGAPGSNAGPNYDVILTAKTTAGAAVCTAGYSTEPPIAKGQQLIPLAFRLFYPSPTGKLAGVDAGRRPPVQYLLEVNINTQSPNDDANPANGFQSKTFTFPAGGKPSCEKLLNH
jgi:hypothetical protein